MLKQDVVFCFQTRDFPYRYLLKYRVYCIVGRCWASLLLAFRAVNYPDEALEVPVGKALVETWVVVEPGTSAGTTSIVVDDHGREVAVVRGVGHDGGGVVVEGVGEEEEGFVHSFPPSDGFASAVVRQLLLL